MFVREVLGAGKEKRERRMKKRSDGCGVKTRKTMSVVHGEDESLMKKHGMSTAGSGSMKEEKVCAASVGHVVCGGDVESGLKQVKRRTRRVMDAEGPHAGGGETPVQTTLPRKLRGSSPAANAHVRSQDVDALEARAVAGAQAHQHEHLEANLVVPIPDSYMQSLELRPNRKKDIDDDNELSLLFTSTRKRRRGADAMSNDANGQSSPRKTNKMRSMEKPKPPFSVPIGSMTLGACEIGTKKKKKKKKNVVAAPGWSDARRADFSRSTRQACNLTTNAPWKRNRTSKTGDIPSTTSAEQIRLGDGEKRHRDRGCDNANTTMTTNTNTNTNNVRIQGDPLDDLNAPNVIEVDRVSDRAATAGAGVVGRTTAERSKRRRIGRANPVPLSRFLASASAQPHLQTEEDEDDDDDDDKMPRAVARMDAIASMSQDEEGCCDPIENLRARFAIRASSSSQLQGRQSIGGPREELCAPSFPSSSGRTRNRNPIRHSSHPGRAASALMRQMMVPTAVARQSRLASYLDRGFERESSDFCWTDDGSAGDDGAGRPQSGGVGASTAQECRVLDDFDGGHGGVTIGADVERGARARRGSSRRGANARTTQWPARTNDNVVDATGDFPVTPIDIANEDDDDDNYGDGHAARFTAAGGPPALHDAHTRRPTPFRNATNMRSPASSAFHHANFFYRNGASREVFISGARNRNADLSPGSASGAVAADDAAAVASTSVAGVETRATAQEPARGGETSGDARSRRRFGGGTGGASTSAGPGSRQSMFDADSMFEEMMRQSLRDEFMDSPGAYDDIDEDEYGAPGFLLGDDDGLRGVMLQSLPLQLRLALRDDDFTADDYEELLKLDDSIVRKGMPERNLQQLPTERCTKTSAETCCVCLEQHSKGQFIKTLPCGHRFHRACIDTWLRQKPKCPICMKKVM